MRRWFLGIVGLSVAAFAVVVMTTARRPEQLEPEALVTAAPVDAPGPAPLASAVVLHVKDATSVEAPFELRDDATAACGVALGAPLSAGSPKKPGRATFALEVTQAGKYHAWVRGRWGDECSNSISLAVGKSGGRGVGNDDVYNAWHWVEAGTYQLEAKTHEVVLVQREAGAAVEQILFTRDATLRPAGAIVAGKMGAGVRRFADSFARSPGHGLEGWDIVSGRWRIEFSFDPNRIPNQYSLVGKATGPQAAALVKGPPWRGCRLAFSVLLSDGARAGALLDRSADGGATGGAGGELRVEIRAGRDASRLTVAGAGPDRSVDLGGRVRPGQWHRIAVERWAWVLRVFVDGEGVFEALDLEPRAGRLGLFVAGGRVVFDDVEVEETPWAAESGKDLRMPWTVRKGARWYRPASPKGSAVLIGRAGTITTPASALPVEEVIVDEANEHGGTCRLDAPGLVTKMAASGSRAFRSPKADGAAPTIVNLSVKRGVARIRRLAVRYGLRRPALFREGPYHFTERQIEDPSDYLDFTPEEWKAIEQSPDEDKLRRRKKYIPLIASGGAYCVWVRKSGRWQVADGCLTGVGPKAVLRYTQEIVSDLELRARVKLSGAGAATEIILYGEAEKGAGVRVASEGAADPAPGSLALRAPADDAWHRVRIRVSGRELEAALDSQPPKRMRITRGDGGAVLLKVGAGTAYFDDIEFIVPREQPDAAFCAFDRRETGWWREGGAWVDHGGMSCMLASHWVSLVAPKSHGVMWHKRSFGPDVLVALNIEENGEWFGWTHRPSHVHHPYDNICIFLAPGRSPKRGYRLEVNAKNRTATVLYRNGKEVASVLQDETFPIRYTGGHAPYTPRKNRITLVKRGAILRAVINGTEVLRYTDPDPISVKHAGLGGYRTRVNFSHVEIRKLSDGR